VDLPRILFRRAGGLVFCFYILRKMFETYVSMTFLIFRDNRNGTMVILQNCAWKSLYIAKFGAVLPLGTWCARNFGQLSTLKFQCNLVKNVFRQIWSRKPYMWRAFLHHDSIGRKNGSSYTSNLKSSVRPVTSQFRSVTSRFRSVTSQLVATQWPILCQWHQNGH